MSYLEAQKFMFQYKYFQVFQTLIYIRILRSYMILYCIKITHHSYLIARR